MSRGVLEAIRDTLHDPVRIQIGEVYMPVDEVEQAVLPVHTDQKIDLLVHFLREHKPERTLIFTRTKHRADRLERHLKRHGIKGAIMHSNRSQEQREKALKGFKTGRYNVLIATDIVARIVGEHMRDVLGQSFYVENKPGGSGIIGTEYVAHQPPDGYTLLLVSNTHVMNLSFFKKLPYDPIKDFEPISLIATVPFVMTVNSSLPVYSLKEFIEYARAHPGQVTYGSAGIGQPHHLAAELLKAMTGIQMTHVPYKGASGIVPALLANEITVTIGAINSLLPHIRSGKLRPLAVAANHRTSLLPDVPTMRESGYDVVVDSWLGVFLPPKTPAEVVTALSAALHDAVKSKEMVDALDKVGNEPTFETPAKFAEIVKADIDRWGPVVKQSGFVADE